MARQKRPDGKQAYHVQLRAAPEEIEALRSAMITLTARLKITRPELEITGVPDLISYSLYKTFGPDLLAIMSEYEVRDGS